VNTHGVKKGIKTMGLHHKQKIYNTARCLETAFYTLPINVLISPLYFNPLNAELNPICYLLALLAHYTMYQAVAKQQNVRSNV